ncbi:MAG: putative lipid II flippase FtsW [Actinobacteria bacterium]|nr:putative lipid II flippase FtsW [Actinomycetota bacterium]
MSDVPPFGGPTSNPISNGATNLTGPAASEAPVAQTVTSGRLDYRLFLVLVVTLCLVGLLAVLSASSVASLQVYGDPWYYFEHQGAYLVLGGLAFFVAQRMKMSFWQRMARPLLIFSALALVAVLVHGRSAGGASRWIGLGPVEFQPSELAKLAVVIFAADVVARREGKGSWGYRAGPVLGVLVFFGLLIIKQPDLGTAVVVCAIGLAVLFAAGLPLSWLGVAGALATLGGVGLALSAPYRMARLTSFLHPGADATTSGYQSLQGLMTLATGHLTGAGIGQSLASWGYLPNQYTDFIYAVIGQETGLVGATIILVLFAAIGWVGTRIAWRAPSTFESLVAVGVTAWLVLQGIVNAGAVAAVLPVTGVPLPFVSYGGSSLIIDLFASGLLANVARRSATLPAPELRAGSLEGLRGAGSGTVAAS